MGEIILSRYVPYPWHSVSAQELGAAVVISSIKLHPSLQRKGFLSALQEQLLRVGVDALVLDVVFNPSWAYGLYLKSLQSDDVVLISGAETVDFDRHVAPGPTFVLKLKACG